MAMARSQLRNIGCLTILYRLSWLIPNTVVATPTEEGVMIAEHITGEILRHMIQWVAEISSNTGNTSSFQDNTVPIPDDVTGCLMDTYRMYVTYPALHELSPSATCAYVNKTECIIDLTSYNSRFNDACHNASGFMYTKNETLSCTYLDVVSEIVFLYNFSLSNHPYCLANTCSINEFETIYHQIIFPSFQGTFTTTTKDGINYTCVATTAKDALTTTSTKTSNAEPSSPRNGHLGITVVVVVVLVIAMVALAFGQRSSHINNNNNSAI